MQQRHGASKNLPDFRSLDPDAYDSLAGMEGLPSIDEPGPRSRLFRHAATLYPGLVAVATITLAATFLSQHYATPVMLFALLIGMTFHFLQADKRCAPGINFASKRLLRFGVALLGTRITVQEVASLGYGPALTVFAGVATTIGFGILCSRWLGLGRQFGLLSGGSVSICGASAALAIASVLPAGKDSERDTILVVVTVTCLSTVAMIFYPALVTALGFDHVHAGIFLGGTIHDVAQVVGAGYMISPETGDIATYVKMLRVAMLAPVVVLIALAATRRTGGKRAGPVFPLFLSGFALLVVVNSLGLLPALLVQAIDNVAKWCLVAAIAALGVKTSLQDLTRVGWRPVALMIAETAWIALLVLISVRYLI